VAQSASQRTDNSNPTQQTTPDETDQVYRIKVGGDVSAPKLIHLEEPKLSMTLRKSREIQTTWMKLKLYVEKDGSPSNISVVGIFDRKGAPIIGADSNPIYNELEEDAIEGAKLYRFKPGTKNGKPVRVELDIVVSFRGS
jgi:hypothetical protein